MSKYAQREAFKSPRFGQPSTFMRLPHEPQVVDVDVALIGVPYDGGTSYRPGARLGPREIRAQSSLIRPYSHFLKVSPFERLRIVDAGDVDAAPISIEKCYEAVESRVSAVLAASAVPVVVGGDHSISLPVLRAVAKAKGPVSLVHFDAHIDTQGDYFGSKYFHGSPFRRAIEECLIDPGKYIQIGIRGPMYGDAVDFDFQRKHGVTTIDIDTVHARFESVIEQIRSVASGPTYVTFDIDAVDPAFAPGTGTPEVGGLTSHQAQRLIRNLAGMDIVGCDVVEVSPPFDSPGQITSLLAANLIFELLCVLALRTP